jgi:hypothetical protein
MTKVTTTPVNYPNIRAGIVELLRDSWIEGESMSDSIKEQSRFFSRMTPLSHSFGLTIENHKRFSTVVCRFEGFPSCQEETTPTQRARQLTPS